MSSIAGIEPTMVLNISMKQHFTNKNWRNDQSYCRDNKRKYDINEVFIAEGTQQL